MVVLLPQLNLSVYGRHYLFRLTIFYTSTGNKIDTQNFATPTKPHYILQVLHIVFDESIDIYKHFL